MNCNKNIDVSVIVASYEPNPVLMKRTLFSILNQSQDISMEIIVCDDGSKEDHVQDIDQFISQYEPVSYRFVKQPQNVGTVMNVLAGVKAAVGKYVYLISPGDYLYDEHSLRKMVDFAEKEDCDICFGNVVCYCAQGDGYTIRDDFPPAPLKPAYYSDDISDFDKKNAFFCGNFIYGPAYLRRRTAALKYFSQLEGVSRLTEDNTSMALALYDGAHCKHFDRNIVWYECASGVSNNQKSPRFLRVQEDLKSTFRLLKKQYPDDTVLKTVFTGRDERLKNIYRLFSYITHPKVLLSFLRYKKAPSAHISYDQSDLSFLDRIFSVK